MNGQRRDRLFRRDNKRALFREGETVRVKSQTGITEALRAGDPSTAGLFMEQMKNYCGKPFPVSRVVNSFFNERKKRTFRPREPLYILGNIICDGNDKYPSKCDHGCFILWHEDWLEKA